MTEPITFGRWLKRLRIERDLTQEMLAELAGCATSTLRSFEMGKRRPSREMTERLVMVLKLPAAQQTEFLRLARMAVQRPSEPSADESAEAGQAKLLSTPPLPKPITPMIGRQAEQSVVCHLIQYEGARLLTLLGAGGMGKTRLALAVASELTSYFTDGAGFVALAGLEDGQHLPAAVAHALNIPLLGARDPAEQIVSVLSTRTMLLILDNFEHLLLYPQAVQWISNLLAQATGLQLLITSRERLRIGGERVFELGGLTVASHPNIPETSDALLLFLERAQATVADFVLNQANRAAIEHICHLVGGMPLGIELAATWVSVLNPAEIAVEIEHSVDFLTRADRDSDPRHHSMRAVFDHSWSLLTEDERSVLARLSVFRGGCQRAAAVAVTGATLPILAGLIDKSLLRKSEGSGGTRYDIHELIRQYAAEQLRANPAGYEQVLRRHGEHYCTFVAEQSVAIGEQQQRSVINELQREIDNIRFAWDWAVQTRRGDLLYPMGRVMWIFCEIQNYYSEGEMLFARAADMAQVLRQEQANDQRAAGERKANDLLFGRMTTHQAYFVARLVRPRQALTLLAPALAVLRQHDDYHTLSQSLWTQGRASWIYGNFAEAEANLCEGLVIAEQLQFPNLLALYHTFLGAILHEMGKVEEAYQHLQKALTFARQMAEPRSNALAICYLHHAALTLGRGEEVVGLLREGLRMARAANDWYCLALALEQQGLAQVAQANENSASAHFAESLAIFRKICDVWSQSRLHTQLGHLALRQNDLTTAETHFQQAVQIGYRAELMACIVNGLAGLALLAMQQGHFKRALTLALTIQQHPASNYITQMHVEKLSSELAGKLSPLEHAAVQTRVAATPLDRLVSEFVGINT